MTEEVKIWIGEQKDVCAITITFDYAEHWISAETIALLQRLCGALAGEMVAVTLNKIHND